MTPVTYIDAATQAQNKKSAAMPAATLSVVSLTSIAPSSLSLKARTLSPPPSIEQPMVDIKA